MRKIVEGKRLFFMSEGNSRVFSYALVFLLTYASPLLMTHVSAAEVEVQQLHFGTFALVDNLTVSTLRVPYNGNNPVASNKLYPLVFGQAGHYSLSALPAWSPIIVTISDFVLKVGMSEEFTIGSFTHDAIIADGNGDALLKLGATLSTSGSGTMYGDAVYTGTMSLVISW